MWQDWLKNCVDTDGLSKVQSFRKPAAEMYDPEKGRPVTRQEERIAKFNATLSPRVTMSRSTMRSSMRSSLSPRPQTTKGAL